jgi:phage terminase large subunit-like protein
MAQRRGSQAQLTQPSRSDDVIEFCETFLTIPEGAHVGRRVVLREWQREIIRGIYDTPTRRAIVSFARKSGKTALTAMLLLAHLVGPEQRRNAQIFSAAQSRDQASIVFGLAAKMVRMSRELNELVVVRDSAKQLFCPGSGVTYRALSADATTAYGLSPVLVIHDELGQVRGPRSELYDALETAMGAQAAPLSIVISTQAPTDADLLSVLIDDAKAAHDPTTKLFLYAADMDDDPWTEATWRKANPALGDFRSLDDMRQQAERAKRLPAFEAAFRNLCLNQRIAVENHFLMPEVWKLNAGEPDSAAFDDNPVYAGLDLSARQDLTALVLVAKDATGVVHVRPEFWAPAGGLRERAERDRVPYDLWRDQGHLVSTPGNSVDYGFVAKRVAEIRGSCDLRAVRYDRWRINDFQRELAAIGCDVPLEPHGQGWKDMSPALETLSALAVDGKLRHGDHPILKFCAACAVVEKDAAGNIKVAKNRSTGRVDGIVALAMAVAGLTQTAPPEPEPKYQMVILSGARR